jgi:hypothetical protein
MVLCCCPAPDSAGQLTPSLLMEYAMTWDRFMNYLSVQSHQLPALERLECDIFPRLTTSFFHMHGHKIRLFRTTSWSAGGFLAEALSLCSNLESFVVSPGSEPIGFKFPIFHPTIQKICIIPSVEADIDVPQCVFEYTVMSPLDSMLKSIEKMGAPRLIELRIRNIGAFGSVLDYSAWLHFWWRRWNIRGIHFLDKSGVSFHEIYDRMFIPPFFSWLTYALTVTLAGERILDSVRG